jgi:hypothetical protein
VELGLPVQQQQRWTGSADAHENLCAHGRDAVLSKTGKEVDDDVHEPFSLATARQPMSRR